MLCTHTCSREHTELSTTKAANVFKLITVLLTHTRETVSKMTLLIVQHNHNCTSEVPNTLLQHSQLTTWYYPLILPNQQSSKPILRISIIILI